MSSKIVKKFGADRLIRWGAYYAIFVAVLFVYDWSLSKGGAGSIIAYFGFYMMMLFLSTLFVFMIGGLCEMILEGEED
ncbi:hypothetical protein [Taklimakanibacter albus]|uniref:Uncharacterized protein n=1 Tax=Taklimakanibacter albus TaxID=2800327 RepID=A0ACC5RGE2_9HYPH|nr:hypothetical protein [Aestuariivirga sp. YIM B02566]MBK1871540.1 hypothetical protein [Aestuariivirga sp. YIM B02566]